MAVNNFASLPVPISLGSFSNGQAYDALPRIGTFAGPPLVGVYYAGCFAPHHYVVQSIGTETVYV